MAERDELKRWACRNGHVMGVVKRTSGGVRRLMLYRQAISQEEEVEVLAVVEGYVADVRCSVCGEVRSWFPGPEARR